MVAVLVILTSAAMSKPTCLFYQAEGLPLIPWKANPVAGIKSHTRGLSRPMQEGGLPGDPKIGVLGDGLGFELMQTSATAMEMYSKRGVGVFTQAKPSPEG